MRREKGKRNEGICQGELIIMDHGTKLGNKLGFRGVKKSENMVDV